MAKVKLIIWRCGSKKCGHEFYGQFYKKQAWHRRFLRKPEMIKCPVCKEVTAVRNRIAVREIMIEDTDKERT